ncbi:hypothetical protein CsatB_010313 [Cannabis sativa]|uniref:uncharacterized protein LOC133038372 n=1 Tax=Cannabis sativa TaxID=3483 RepID=UPI0029CA3033|nr:uncharacterized protein LOC133038372 [Cannabis sativa]
MCQSINAGGLGFRKIHEWNQAAMGKYIWAIAQKHDSLWLKWINSVYLKEHEWWSYKAPPQSSWYWRRLVNLKDHFRDIAGHQNCTQQQNYQVKTGYSFLCPDQDKVQWSQQVWGRLNTPKHSFILWLAIQGRLRTKDTLRRMGMNIDEHCEFCSTQNESADHLFFQCRLSAACLQGIKQWLSWKVSADTLSTLTRWIGRSKISKFRKNLLAAALACLVYTLWKNRNLSVWEKKKPNAEKMIIGMRSEVLQRVAAVWPKTVTVEDANWFHGL